MNPFVIVPFFCAALVAASAMLGSWFTIDQKERGVLLRNGAVTGVAEPGLHFKLPFIDGVSKISTQSQAIRYSNIPAYSRDQQPAVIELSLNYHLPADAVTDIYTRYGNEDGVLNRLVYPQLMEELKTVFGQFNAVTSIQERARLNTEVFQAVQAAVEGPVVIESVQIENIDFSDAYEKSIEERMLAEVEVQKVRQNAEREKVTAEITVIQAQAEADAKLAQAESDAKAIRMRGDAEADAINAKGRALRDNPALVSLTQAERWDGVLPTTMVPGNTVPFMNMSTN